MPENDTTEIRVLVGEAAPDEAEIYAFVKAEAPKVLSSMKLDGNRGYTSSHMPKLNLNWGRGELMLEAFQNQVTKGVALSLGSWHRSVVPDCAKIAVRSALVSLGYEPVFGWDFGGNEHGFNFLLNFVFDGGEHK